MGLKCDGWVEKGTGWGLERVFVATPTPTHTLVTLQHFHGLVEKAKKRVKLKKQTKKRKIV